MEDLKLVTETGKAVEGVHGVGDTNENNSFGLLPCGKISKKRGGKTGQNNDSHGKTGENNGFHLSHDKTGINNGFDLRSNGKTGGENNSFDLHPHGETGGENNGFGLRLQGKTGENNGFWRNTCENDRFGLRLQGKTGENNGLDLRPHRKTGENNGFGLRPHCKTGENNGFGLRPHCKTDNGFDIHPQGKTCENNGFDLRPQGKTCENNDFDLRSQGKTDENNGFDLRPHGKTYETNGFYLRPQGKTDGNNGFYLRPQGKAGENNSFDLLPQSKTRHYNGFNLHPQGKTCENGENSHTYGDYNGFDLHHQGKTCENGENSHTYGKRHHADILFSSKKPRVGPAFGGKTLQAYSRRKYLERSHISDFPDDILLHVLSFLTIKEAGRTGVLSKRWRHMWAHIPTLNFDSCNISHEVSVAQKELEVSKARYKSTEPDKHSYIHWVDQVVRLHKAPIIDEFRVQCDMENDNGKNIDEWVRFAMKKTVRTIGMDISPSHGTQDSHYTFPISSFSILLASLELSAVNVTGEALEAFLHNCPVLEFLSVRDSRVLVDLKVIGPTLKLKYLIIYDCFEMEKMEISVPNLIYFSYCGPIVSLLFRNNPKLSEISLGGQYGIHVTNNLMEHSSYLSELEVLSFILPCPIENAILSARFPDWTKLKKLVVCINPRPSHDLYGMKALVKACPFLNRVEFQINGDTGVGFGKLSSRMWETDYAHYHLKVVQIVGLDGSGQELVLFLMDVCVSLEKIIIDPRRIWYIRDPCAFESCNAKRARARAKVLGQYLNPGTDLVVL